MIIKKICYKVQCPCGKIFDKVFQIEEGTEDQQSERQAYCPYCDKFVTVTIQGKWVACKGVLRKFGISTTGTPERPSK